MFLYSNTLDVPIVTTLVIDDLSFHSRSSQSHLGKRRPVPLDIIPDEGPKRPRLGPAQGEVRTGSGVWDPNSWANDPSGQFQLPLYRDNFGTVWVLQPNPNFTGTNERWVAWMSLNNWEIEHGWASVYNPPPPDPPAVDPVLDIDIDDDDDEDEMPPAETWQTAQVSPMDRQEMLKAIAEQRKRLARRRVQQANQDELKRIKDPHPFMSPPAVPRKSMLDTPVVQPKQQVSGTRKTPFPDKPVAPLKRRIYDPSAFGSTEPKDQSKKHSDKENFFAFYDVPGKGPLPLSALPKGAPGTEHRREFDFKALGVVNAGPGNTVSSFDEAVADGPVAVAAWIHDIQVAAATNRQEREQADADFIDFLEQVPEVKRDGAWHVAYRAIKSGVQHLWYYLYGYK